MGAPFGGLLRVADHAIIAGMSTSESSVEVRFDPAPVVEAPPPVVVEEHREPDVDWRLEHGSRHESESAAWEQRHEEVVHRVDHLEETAAAAVTQLDGRLERAEAALDEHGRRLDEQAEKAAEEAAHDVPAPLDTLIKPEEILPPAEERESEHERTLWKKLWNG